MLFLKQRVVFPFSHRYDIILDGIYPKVNISIPNLLNSTKSEGKSNGLSPKKPKNTDIKTTHELFEYYRCQLCKDVTVDNVDLIDGEMVRKFH